MPRRKKVENLSLEEMLMKTEQEIKTTEEELKELRLKINRKMKSLAHYLLLEKQWKRS